jgi:hypothetical protein
MIMHEPAPEPLFLHDHDVRRELATKMRAHRHRCPVVGHLQHYRSALAGGAVLRGSGDILHPAVWVEHRGTRNY